MKLKNHYEQYNLQTLSPITFWVDCYVEGNRVHVDFSSDSRMPEIRKACIESNAAFPTWGKAHAYIMETCINAKLVVKMVDRVVVYRDDSE